MSTFSEFRMRPRHYKQRCRLGPQVSKSDAPVSEQASANRFDHTQYSTFSFGSGTPGFSTRRKQYKQRSRIGPQLSESDSPVSEQASANRFDHTQFSTFSSGNNTPATTSATASLSFLFTNDAQGPVYNFSSLEKSDPAEKENISCMDSSSSCRVEVKQNKATRQEANKEPVKNSALPLTTVSRILNGIPQNPHFFQLRNCSKLSRKNLISAWDQIFEETVKEIHSLQVVDFWVRAKKLWKTMEDLQNIGYNVIPLRRRLVELTDVMRELKLSQLDIKGLKIKAENHRMEKNRFENLIVFLQAMVKREEESVENLLIQAAKLENDLPRFGDVFAQLAIEPL